MPSRPVQQSDYERPCCPNLYYKREGGIIFGVTRHYCNCTKKWLDDGYVESCCRAKGKFAGCSTLRSYGIVSS